MKDIIKIGNGFPAICVFFSKMSIRKIEFRNCKKAHIAENILYNAEKKWIRRLGNNMKAYFKGEKVNFRKLDIHLSNATKFQQKVWKAIRTIPYGETRTYKWIAEKIGQPSACRAIGRACGANPVPILVPCHRVVASDGSLGGFAGGIGLKKKLLMLERTIL